MGSRLPMLILATCLVAACAAPRVATTPRGEVTLTPDDPDNPRIVRFDVPTAMIMGLPGDRMPVTLEARLSTREIATRELAAAGYCPNGFTGPEGVSFPGGDRGRSAFVVECVGR
jgi:hypothetical protein